MSKRNQERKARAAQSRQARQVTPGKLLRIFLKSLAFAMVVGVLFAIAGWLGVPYIENRAVQFAVIFLVYLVAYPFLMSEFRPKKRER